MQDQNDDVERGYYVYVHRDRATGTPFYVGKGKGRRAHSPTDHNSDWDDMVVSLKEGYDVEIVQEDLTEGDAYDLERETIRKYGRTSEGGTLVNVTGGGTLDMGECVVEMSIQLPPEMAKRMQDEYEKAKYRQLTGEERTAFTDALKETMKQLHDRYYEAVDIDSDEIEETDFELEVENIISQVSTAADQYARRKISSKAFGYEIEGLFDELEDTLEDLEDSEGEKAEVIEIAKEFLTFMKKQVRSIKPSSDGPDPSAE